MSHYDYSFISVCFFIMDAYVINMQQCYKECQLTLNSTLLIYLSVLYVWKIRSRKTTLKFSWLNWKLSVHYQKLSEVLALSFILVIYSYHIYVHIYKNILSWLKFQKLQNVNYGQQGLLCLNSICLLEDKYLFYSFLKGMARFQLLLFIFEMSKNIHMSKKCFITYDH